MTDPPGQLLASGRAADVYDLGDGTVLRRYRQGQRAEAEAAAMTWLADRGLPVPRVHRADGGDLVMARIDGPTMLADLARRPWRLATHARTLAALQRRIAGLAAPDWFPERAGVPAGTAVLHLDLHPMNVVLGPAGPVVIDWTNVARGDAAFDAAVSYVLMATFEATTPLEVAGRRAFVEAFATARGRSLVRRRLAEACAHRRRDPNTTAAERVALDRLAARAARRATSAS